MDTISALVSISGSCLLWTHSGFHQMAMTWIGGGSVGGAVAAAVGGLVLLLRTAMALCNDASPNCFSRRQPSALLVLMAMLHIGCGSIGGAVAAAVSGSVALLWLGFAMAWWRHCGSTTEWRWRRGEQWNSGGGFVWNDGANDFGGLLTKFESPLKIGASNF
jgi:hypothetical protein